MLNILGRYLEVVCVEDPTNGASGAAAGVFRFKLK